jgi:general secretion pathway protein I
MNQRGFTLIEIIVALAVFAIVAVVMYRSTGDTLVQTRRVEERTFATWVARNTLASIELARQQPRAPLPAGRETREATLAGREWNVLAEVTATTHPDLQRVDVSVWPQGADTGGAPAARVSGFLGVH